MRVLFITPRPFWPPRKGEQARLVGFLSHLPPELQVEVLSLVPPGARASPAPFPCRQSSVYLRTWTAITSLLRYPTWPAQVAIHYDRNVLTEVRATVARFQPQVVVLLLSRLAWLLPHLAEVPCVVDFVDSLALNMRHRAKTSPLLAPFWLWESARCARWDRQSLQWSTFGAVVAKRDREAMVSQAPELASKLRIVPFGVEVDRCAPRATDPPMLLLSGNLGYFPTATGALWFGKRVWPLLKKAHPQLRLVMAGARPPRRLLALSRLGVQIVPNPPDLAPWRRQATLAVAPLGPGSGTPIKVLEAMAVGLPVVASPAAVAGLDEVPPEAITVAQGVEDWVAAIDALLRQPSRAQHQAVAAFRWVKEHHDVRALAQRFASLLWQAAAG